jgi:hypothetical protein
MMVEYRSFGRLVAFGLLSAVYTLMLLAAVDGIANFRIWMVALLACAWIPLFFVAWAVRLSPDARLEIRYLLRTRNVPVASVRSIELTRGVPDHRVKVRFSRWRSLNMKDDAAALELVLAFVRINPGIEVAGFEDAFDTQ